MGRWILVTLLLTGALVVAFVILSVTNVIDGPALLWKFGLSISWLQPHLETYSRGSQSEEWMAARESELEAEQGRVADFETELLALEKELEQRKQALERREAELDKREAELEAERAQRRNVQTLAELYSEMPPAEAAPILQKLDQPLLLEILLAMDTQDAANVLLQLPTDLAAALSKSLGAARD